MTKFFKVSERNGRQAKGEGPMHLLICTIICIGTVSPLLSATAAQSLTIQGRITTSSGHPINGASTQFRVRILTPSANECILYDESQTLDLSQSDGLFSLNLASGLSLVNNPATYTLEQALSNRASFNVSASFCKAGSGLVSFTPSLTANRKVEISFRDPDTMSSFESIPVMEINPVAYAMEARALNGFSSGSFLRVENSGVPGNATALSTAHFNELQKLISGTSNNYMSSISGATEGAKLPTVLGRPSSPATGSLWFDTGSGTIKFFDGSSDQTVGSGSSVGSVITSITAGAGLTGGGGSGAVNLALSPLSPNPAGTFGSTAQIPRLTVDIYGRITNVALQTVSGLMPTVGASGNVARSDGTAWTSAYLNAGDIRSSVSGASVFPGSSCSPGTALIWNSGTDRLECQAIALGTPAAAVAHNYSKVTVAADGRVNGGSNPSTLSGYGITDALSNALGVPTIQAGSMASRPISSDTGALYVDTQGLTLYRYNGVSWEVIGTTGGSVAEVLAGTGLQSSRSGSTATISMPNVGAPNSYLKVTTDPQGRVTSGSTALTSADVPNLDWTKITSGKPSTLGGYGITDSLVSNAGGALSMQVGSTSGRGAAGIAGRIFVDTQINNISYDTGVAWQNIVTGASFTGALTGDVSGTQGATVVNNVGGSTAPAVNAATVLVNGATSLESSGTLVRRDSTGGVAAAVVGARALQIKDSSTNSISLTAAATTAPYTLQLPATAPAPGQSLQSDGSGVLSWVTAAAGTLNDVLAGTGISVSGSGRPER